MKCCINTDMVVRTHGKAEHLGNLRESATRSLLKPAVNLLSVSFKLLFFFIKLTTRENTSLVSRSSRLPSSIRKCTITLQLHRLCMVHVYSLSVSQ